MRLHRFFGNFDLSQPKITVHDKDLVKQWKTVLRLEAGKELFLCDGKGTEALATIRSIDKSSAELDITGTRPSENEPEIEVTIYCSILKKENFEWAVQKAVEAGVKEIIPVIGHRTVKMNLNLKRLEKIIKEASEQSGRGIIPSLGEPMNLADAIKHSKKNSTNIFFRPSGIPLDKVKIADAKVGVFIGPEGGWDDSETELAEKNDFAMATLGKLILRAETAAAVASYLVVNKK